MPPSTSSPLPATLRTLGEDLARTLAAVLDALPEAGQGPQRLGAAVGMDKVFAHRLLKCVHAGEPHAVLLAAPGPDPLLRFVHAAEKRGATTEDVTSAAAVLERFRSVLREEVGDRSKLDAILTAYVPEARVEFELRRKQAVFKAQSQLKGISAATNFGAVFLHPSAAPEHAGMADVVWVAGLYGLQRWQPGARTKVSTRRFVVDGEDRRPTTLAGERVEGLDGLRLDQFCAAPPAELAVRHVGETVHYVLAGDELGQKANRDLVFAEVNVGELSATPRPGRRPYVFVEISTPAKRLVFDVFVHHSLWTNLKPELGVYDTAFDGVVDVNDPAREIDRMQTSDLLTVLGQRPDQLVHAHVPHHAALLAHVHEALGWDPSAFHGWRAAVDYPLYGAQVAVSFAPPGA